MKEGYRLKDKAIILEYHLKWPLQALNFILGKKNSRNLRGNVFIKNSNGLFFCGNNFSSVFGAGSFCEPEIRKEFTLNEGVAIDVGANLGMFSVPLAKILGNKGKVISIEAEKKNIGLLRKNIQLNNLRNVFIIGKGAYSKRGEMIFYLDDFGTGGHSLLKGNTLKKEKIQVDTIDNILNNLNIKEVKVIKIDVEGAEREVLKGAEKILKNSHPKIIFEATDEQKKWEVENLLSHYNYKIRRIGEWNYVAEI
jgi:FkbM family methyltransferase